MRPLVARCLAIAAVLAVAACARPAADPTAKQVANPAADPVADPVACTKPPARQATCAKPAAEPAACAVSQVLDLYPTGGMATLEADSRQCWSQKPVEAYCLYLDTAARQLDVEFAGSLGIGPYPYYDQQAFLERSRPYFDAAGMDMQQANALLSGAYEAVVAELERQRSQTPPARGQAGECPGEDG